MQLLVSFWEFPLFFTHIEYYELYHIIIILIFCLSKVVKQIKDQESNIANLEQAIRDKEDPLKVAQTRLYNRTYRPGVEMCRDPSQYQWVSFCSIILYSWFRNIIWCSITNSHFKDMLLHINNLWNKGCHLMTSHFCQIFFRYAQRIKFQKEMKNKIVFWVYRI